MNVMTNIMEYKEYRSDICENFIVYKIDSIEKKISIDNMYYRPENIKLFLMDLSNSLQNIQITYNDKYKFIQVTTLDDWNQYLKNNEQWSLLSSDQYTATIECSLQNALENIIKGLGIYFDHTEYDSVELN